MDLIQIIILAIVQGLTEFLPISSSAHLILVPLVLKWPDQGLAFDVAVHVGSLIAVLYYFRKTVRSLLQAWFGSLMGGKASDDSRLAWWVIFATIPAVIFGYIFKGAIETELRSPWVIATTTIAFGLLLLLADKVVSGRRDETQLRLFDVIVIGLFQAIALIPGTSRSGITMTAGLFLGMSRRAAARFSFLLSMPLIVAGGTLLTRDLIQSSIPVDWTALLIAVVLSALSAGLCIHLFLNLIDRIGMMPFVIYRLVLGCLLIVLLI